MKQQGTTTAPAAAAAAAAAAEDDYRHQQQQQHADDEVERSNEPDNSSHANNAHSNHTSSNKKISFMESLEASDPLLASLVEEYRRNGSKVSAADDLEIGMRRRALELAVAAPLAEKSDGDGGDDVDADGDDAMKEVTSFWKRCLRVCRRLLLEIKGVGRSGGAGGGGGAGADAGGSPSRQEESNEKRKEIEAAAAPHLAKIPFVLLDDVFDVLADEGQCAKFWGSCVEGKSASAILFDEGDCFWSHHTCWLAFLKLCSKLIKRQDGAPLAARVMGVLAEAYPLGDKSATRIWGSRNTETSTEFEDRDEFDRQQRDQQVSLLLAAEDDGRNSNKKKDGSADKVVSGDFYTIYESFWSLQQDFTSPYVKNLASFLLRLRTLLQAIEQQRPKDGEGGTRDGEDPLTGCRKYLTSSRLLTSQLSSPTFCHTVLLQFLIVAHSLSAQAPTVGQRLQAMLIRARKLLPKAHLDVLQTVLKTDDEWSRWKKTKQQPTLEKRKKIDTTISTDGAMAMGAPGSDESIVSETSSRKRSRTLRGSPLSSSFKAASYDQSLTPSFSSRENLAQMSVNLRGAVPSLDTHLAEYIDAMDPDSGIEPEYNPKNNRYFCWQALRLLSQENFQEFTHVLPNGDYENVVRRVYEDRGIDIPGEPLQYPQEEEDDPKEAAMEDATEEQDNNHKLDEPAKEIAISREEDITKSTKDDEKPDVDMKEAVEDEKVALSETKVVEGPKTREESVTSRSSRSASQHRGDNDKRNDDREKPGDRRDGGGSRDKRSPSRDDVVKKGDDRKEYKRTGSDHWRNDVKRTDNRERDRADETRRPDDRPHHREEAPKRAADQNGDKATHSHPAGPCNRGVSQLPPPPPASRGGGGIGDSRDRSGGRSGSRGGAPARPNASPPRLSPQDVPGRDGGDRWRQGGPAGGRDRDRRRPDSEDRVPGVGRDDYDDRRGSGGGTGAGGRRGGPRDDQRGGGERWEDRRGEDWGRRGGGGRDHNRRRARR